MASCFQATFGGLRSWTRRRQGTEEGGHKRPYVTVCFWINYNQGTRTLHAGIAISLTFESRCLPSSLSVSLSLLHASLLHLCQCARFSPYVSLSFLYLSHLSSLTFSRSFSSVAPLCLSVRPSPDLSLSLFFSVSLAMSFSSTYLYPCLLLSFTLCLTFSLSLSLSLSLSFSLSLFL